MKENEIKLVFLSSSLAEAYSGGQFVDRGPQYRSVIFYHDEEQKRLAERSKEAIDRSGKFKKPVLTEIVKLKKFYEAEDDHQDYFKKNPMNYYGYRMASGRDQFSEKVWGKSVDGSKGHLKKGLCETG